MRGQQTLGSLQGGCGGVFFGNSLQSDTYVNMLAISLLQGQISKFFGLLRHFAGLKEGIIRHHGKRKPCLWCWQGVEGW